MCSAQQKDDGLTGRRQTLVYYYVRMYQWTAPRTFLFGCISNYLFIMIIIITIILLAGGNEATKTALCIYCECVRVHIECLQFAAYLFWSVFVYIQFSSWYYMAANKFVRNKFCVRMYVSEHVLCIHMLGVKHFFFLVSRQ